MNNKAGTDSFSEITIYEGPATMQSSRQTQVRVNGKKLFVYETAVNNSHTWVPSGKPVLSSTPMTYFDFSGTANIDIEVKEPKTITSCTISPLSRGISPTISGNHVRFSISEPGDYTIQFNGSVVRALHLFANPIETNVPDRNDPRVIYIDPGEWNIGNLSLKSGQTLYLSGGAVVHGTILANRAEGVTIRGRGIIDGSDRESWMLPGQSAWVPVDFRDSRNIRVDGIIILNPNAWTFNSYQSEHAEISNIKIISARPNGDGITLQSCRDFLVRDSFVRSWDDSLVVKNYGSNSEGITFRNITVWTDLAQSCEIGYETNKGMRQNAGISHITFEEITVINNFHKPVISIHNSDDALVRDIVFRNITVENAQMGSGDAGSNNQLIDFTIASSGWSKTRQRGTIRNVLVENVMVLGGKFPPSRIYGYDETHTIKDVRIVNLNILGTRATTLDEAKLITNPYTGNITIE